VKSNTHFPRRQLALRKYFVTALLGLPLIACGVPPAPPPSTTVQVPDIVSITESAVLNATSLESQGGIKVLSSEPTQDAAYVSTEAPFVVSFNTPVKRSLLERGVNLFLGRYDTRANPQGFQKLNVTSICNGRWRVTNPNSAPISFKWDIYKSLEQGIGVVPPQSDVLLQTNKGSKTFRLFVDAAAQSVKASNNKPCTAPMFGFVWDADGKKVEIKPLTVMNPGTYTLTLSTVIRAKGENEAEDDEEDDEKKDMKRLQTPFVVTFDTVSVAETASIVQRAQERKYVFDSTEQYILFHYEQDLQGNTDGSLWMYDKLKRSIKSLSGLLGSANQSLLVTNAKFASGNPTSVLIGAIINSRDTLFRVAPVSGAVEKIEVVAPVGLSFGDLDFDFFVVSGDGKRLAFPAAYQTQAQAAQSITDNEDGADFSRGIFMLDLQSRQTTIAFSDTDKFPQFTSGNALMLVDQPITTLLPRVVSRATSRTAQFALSKTARHASFKATSLAATTPNRRFPLDSGWVVYGSSKHTNQFERRAVDIEQGNYACGGSVFSVMDGVVIKSVDERIASPGSGNALFGNRITILNSDGTRAIYAHLASRAVQEGTRRQPTVVARGTLLGTLGNTGTKDCHLHFSFRNSGNVSDDLVSGGPVQGIGAIGTFNLGTGKVDRFAGEPPCPIVTLHEELTSKNGVVYEDGKARLFGYFYYEHQDGACSSTTGPKLEGPSGTTLIAYAPNDQNPPGRGNTVNAGSLTIKNTGKKVLNYKITLAGQPIFGTVRLTGPIGTLDPAASKAIPIELECRSYGTDKVTVTVTSDGGTNTADVNVNCYGPSLDGPNPSSLTFSLESGASDQKPFTAFNVGNFDLEYVAPLTVTSPGGAVSSVTVTSGNGIITKAGETNFTATATCSGINTGTNTHTITLIRKDKVSERINLPVIVTCKAPAAAAKLVPPPADLSLVADVGDAVNGEFSFGNSGDADMPFARGISNATGTDIATIAYNGDPGNSVPAKGTATQGITATCLRGGQASAVITIDAQVAGKGTTTVTVTCRAPKLFGPADQFTMSGKINEALTPASIAFSNKGDGRMRYKISLSGSITIADLVFSIPLGVEQTLPAGQGAALTVTGTCKDVFGTEAVAVNIEGLNGGGNGFATLFVTCKSPKFGTPDPQNLGFTMNVDETQTQTFTVPNIGNLELAYNTPVISGGGSKATVNVSNGRGVITQKVANDPNTGFETFSVTTTCNQAGTDPARTITIVRSDKPEQVAITVNVTCKGTPNPIPDKTILTLEGKAGSSTNVDSVNVTNLAPAATGQYDYTVTFTSNDPSIATLEKTTVGNGVILVNGSQAIGARANCVKPGITSGTMTITGLPNTLSSGKSISVNAYIKCTGPSLYADRDLDFGDVFWGSSTTAGMYLQNFDAVQGINDPATLEYEIVNLPTWLTVVNGTQQGSVLAGRQIEVRFNAACPNLGRFEADVLFRATNVPRLEQTRHFSVNCVSRVDLVARFVGADYYGTYAADSGSKNEVIATVSNDPSNAGVTWTASFGTLSYEGDKVFWTAPIQNPDSGEGFRQVKLTATSRADQTRSGIALGTVRGISVNGGQAAGYGLLRDFVSVTSGVDPYGMLYFYVSYDATRSGVTVSSSLGSIEATGSGFNQNYGAMEYGFKFIPPDLACGAEQLRGTMVITSAADPRRFFSLPIYVNSRPC
jgi:murein DD-endopeptidase MepM/ murein hydrolase activator NlpD